VSGERDEPSWVTLSVGGEHVRVREDLILLGSTDLGLATGEHIPLVPYADSVAIVLEALQKSGVLRLLS
jgi:hypothetical protein